MCFPTYIYTYVGSMRERFIPNGCLAIYEREAIRRRDRYEGATAALDCQLFTRKARRRERKVDIKRRAAAVRIAATRKSRTRDATLVPPVLKCLQSEHQNRLPSLH